MKEGQIGVLIYTFNRIDDAKINMEIIRNVWASNILLQDIPLVHAFNGEKEWWPEKYLEDELIMLENTGHFTGAAELMDGGIDIFHKKYPNISHVVVIASDTWIMKPDYLTSVIQEMEGQKKYLATCGWVDAVTKLKVWRDTATDFFIVDLKWAVKNKMFPLRYGEYLDSYSEVFHLLSMTIYLEQVVLLRFRQALVRDIGPLQSETLVDEILIQFIYLLEEREPITVYHPIYERRMYCPILGLIGHHDPVAKQKVLKTYPIIEGEQVRKFLFSTDLSYYNNNFIVSSFSKTK